MATSRVDAAGAAQTKVALPPLRELAAQRRLTDDDGPDMALTKSVRPDRERMALLISRSVSISLAETPVKVKYLSSAAQPEARIAPPRSSGIRFSATGTFCTSCQSPSTTAYSISLERKGFDPAAWEGLHYLYRGPALLVVVGQHSSPATSTEAKSRSECEPCRRSTVPGGGTGNRKG